MQRITPDLYGWLHNIYVVIDYMTVMGMGLVKSSVEYGITIHSYPITIVNLLDSTQKVHAASPVYWSHQFLLIVGRC